VVVGSGLAVGGLVLVVGGEVATGVPAAVTTDGEDPGGGGCRQEAGGSGRPPTTGE
jgi:hypothetical protein